MKKILFIILIISLIPQVNAKEYTEYTPFSDYQEQVIVENELTDVKVERRHKYYKEIKKLGPYEPKEKQIEEYPLVDLKDYIYKDESEYLTIKPEEKEGRIINTYDGVLYQKAKDVKYVKLINNSDKNIDISNFNLKYEENSINYIVETNNATIDKIENRGIITIKFEKPLMINMLNISFSASSPSSTLTVETYSSENKTISSNSYTIMSNYDLNWQGLNSYIIGEYEPYIEKKEKNLKEGKALIKKEEIPIYTYQDILYRKYRLERQYYNHFLTQPLEDYIYKDESLFKDYYAKRTRQLIIPKEEKTKSQIKPLKTIPENKPNISSLNQIEKKLNINRLQNYDISNNPIPKQEIQMWYFIGPLLILISIFILLLSKLYKRKNKYVKV